MSDGAITPLSVRVVFSSLSLLVGLQLKRFTSSSPQKNVLDPSWLGAARRAYEYHLACRRPVGPEQGTVT
jgi:hypothetical protein